MGLFGGGGILGSILDPGDIMGAGAAADAADLNRDLGYKTLGLQEDWMKYIQGQFEPYSEAGQQALAGQMDILSGNYDPTTDPNYQNTLNRMTGNIMNNAAVSGSVRGGNTVGALGSAVSDLNQQTMNERFNMLGAISGQGMQGSQGLGSFGGNALSGMAGTMSGIGTGALNSAAMQQQQGTGLLGAGMGLLAAFSDVRLKDNIEFTGEYSPKGHEIYSWDWNEQANKLNLYGKGRGVIADKVEFKDPEAVTLDESGFKKVDYARV